MDKMLSVLNQQLQEQADAVGSNMREADKRIIDSAIERLDAFMGDFKQLVSRIDTLEKDVEDLRLQGDELKSNLDRMDNEMVQ